MRTPWKFATSALVLTAMTGGVALGPSFVYGQSALPAPDAVQAQAQPQGDQQRRHRLPSDRIDARLAYLKTALKITPAQETQWNGLANVLRQQARERDTLIEQRRAERDAQRAPGAQRQPSTAIERLQQRQQMLAEEASRMNELLTAARPLYASFSDDQKKTADEMLDRGGHGFRHGRH